MGHQRQKSVRRTIEQLFRAGTAAGLSDAQLLERFATRHGEAAEAAFAALVERHGPMVLRVCRSALGDPHDAQDAFQATFLILVQKPGAVRRRDALAGWLYGVAVRVAAHSRVTAARRRAVETAGRARPSAMPAPDESRQDIWGEVDRLPERYRLAVVLCYLEGLTHEQAAARLGWPVGTVRSRLARARERLRGRLTRRGLAPGVAGTVVAGLAARTEAVPLPFSLVEPTVKAAMSIAAHDAAEAGLVSASAAALTEGVLRTMLFANLKSAALALLVAGAVAAGAGVYGYQAPEPRPEPTPAPAPAAAPVAGDEEEAQNPEYPRKERTRPALPKSRRSQPRAESSDTYAERITALAHAAREQEERGDRRGAAETTIRIIELAGEWSQSLWPPEAVAPSGLARRPRNAPQQEPELQSQRGVPPAAPALPPGGMPRLPVGPNMLPPPARPAGATAGPPLSEEEQKLVEQTRLMEPAARDTERRLAEVEKKLERVLRLLERREAPPELAPQLAPLPSAPPRPPRPPRQPVPPELPVPASPPAPPETALEAVP
jgi:RNA polymerase sigma factor (sigma-70 family)